jgi:hypothetical protein
MLDDESDGRLRIEAFHLDPWVAANTESNFEAADRVLDLARTLNPAVPPSSWPIGFEVALQEQFFWGEPTNVGCVRLAKDFGVVYQPRETVRPIRRHAPSELAAYYLFQECSELSCAALCRANALLGGTGTIRRHEQRTSKYPSGHRSFYLPKDRVNGELDYLVSQVNGQAHDDPFAVAVAAMLHALIIHPFADANGRLSFLLFQYCLFKSGVIRYPILPLGPFLEKHRSEYLYALIASSLRRSIVPFHALLARGLEDTAAAARTAFLADT